jgi:hypothetical protein
MYKYEGAGIVRFGVCFVARKELTLIHCCPGFEQLFDRIIAVLLFGND